MCRVLQPISIDYNGALMWKWWPPQANMGDTACHPSLSLMASKEELEMPLLVIH